MTTSRYDIYCTSKDAWDGMYQAICNAKTSIYWELYMFLDDEVGKKFFDTLAQKAQDGVDVKLTIDYFGSFFLPSKRVQSLRNAGVDVTLFGEREHWYRGLWKRFVTRTHRKILIVDEQIGFIGGVNVQKDMADWMDLHVRIEGKAVRSLLRAFARGYIIAGGEKKNVKHLLKYKFRVEKDIKDVEFIYDEPKKHSRVRKKYTQALLKARERVILFSPYYFPDKKFLQALWSARKRGVKIDLLIPFRSDVRIATYASYAFFSILKKNGVNIHLTDCMMHGKGVVVDDDWAMIGSSNIDQISFEDNYEANVKISDKKTVKKIKTAVETWLEKSTQLEKKNWEKRGQLHKMGEWVALKLRKMWHPKQ